jgi:hypothetical protein
VMAANATDTTYSVCDTTGRFLLQGVDPGMYSVTITPAAPYNPAVISNVSVTAGNVTDIGTVNL